MELVNVLDVLFQNEEKVTRFTISVAGHVLRSSMNCNHPFTSRRLLPRRQVWVLFYNLATYSNHAAQQGSSFPRAYRQPPGSSAISSGPSSTDKRGAMSYYSKMQGQGPPMLPYDSLPLSNSGGSMPPGPSTQSMPATAGGKMCSKCRVKQANPGKGWCDQCFMQSQMNS